MSPVQVSLNFCESILLLTGNKRDINRDNGYSVICYDVGEVQWAL